MLLLDDMVVECLRLRLSGAIAVLMDKELKCQRRRQVDRVQKSKLLPIYLRNGKYD